MGSAQRTERCEYCGNEAPGYDVIYLAASGNDTRRLCTRCFNELMARQTGLAFDHPVFAPVSLEDAVGVCHQFHFRVRHGGDHIALDAFELKEGSPGGYEFQVLGDPEGDPSELFQRLVQRVQRALARQHIEVGSLGPQIAASDGRWIVRGQIDWDEDADERVPRLVIDGRCYSWNEVGRMLMTFEGFNVRMEVHDRSDER
jgi:hypothetical protein